MKVNKIIISAVVALSSATAFAQAPHSGYFMDSMPNRHQLNPAFANEYNYVNMPIIPGFSGLAVGMNGNIGLDKFLFKRNGELVTGLNNQVSAEEFLGGLNDNNYMEANVTYDIFSMGFKKWGGYNTIGLSVKSNTGIGLPYDLFDFAKRGQVGGEYTAYDISDMKVRTNNYAELAFGHSHALSSKVSIGAKLKYIAGIAHADMKINQMDVTMGADKWTIREAGEMFYSEALDIIYKENGEIDDMDFGKINLAGNGFGIDLGVTYSPIRDLTLSASVLDLGFISWKGTNAVLSDKAFEFDGFHHLVAEDDETGESALDREGDQLEDDLRELVRFSHESSTSKSQSLATTLNIGAEYSILARKISFGVLSSNRFGGIQSWNEVMLSANFRPARWFNATLNGSFSNLGNSFGALMNFCPKGFNFYIGSDYIPTKYAKQGVPVSSAKINVVMGMAFKFGYGEKKKAEKGEKKKAEKLEKL